MSKKNTRNALLMSALSLLLCVSMLIGTTFAWFTDTVQSDINTIAAGNLDIELTHQDKNSSGVVDSATKLFDDVALWEPGAMVYEKLTVTNKGSLALKYQLSVNISDITTLSNGNSLKDVLKVAVMTEVPTRENIKTAETKLLETFVLSGDLELKNESDTYYIAIYWAPSASDNDYNVAGEALKATLGVSLVATQMTNEEDSFDDQFDVNASYPAVSIVTGSRGMTLGVDEAPSAITKKTTVEVPAGAFADGAEVGINVDAANSLFNVSAEGDVVGSLDVIMTVNGVQHEDELTGGKTYTVTTYISTGLSNVTVAYTGTDGRAQPTNVQYDPATGMLSFETTHFSEYAVSGKAIAYDAVKDTAYNTVDQVVEALKDTEASVEVAEDVETEVKIELVVKVQDAIENGQIEEDTPVLDGIKEVMDSVAMVDTAEALTEAMLNGQHALLTGDITMTAYAVIPQDKDVLLDLNGHTLNADNATYVLNNLGKLTLKDSVGTGSVNARGIYNGYVADGDKVATATLTIENGVYNATGTNGGACVYNYGIVEIKSGTFTSNGGYALNTQPGSTMTIKEADVTGGIYNCGDLQIENATVFQHISGRHAIYVYAAKLVINSGEFDSISGNELILADGQGASVVLNGGTYNKTAKSWLLGAASGKEITFTINGGTYNGYVNMPEQSVDTIRPYGDPIVVYGGNFNFNPTNWLASGYSAARKADGTYTVITGDCNVVSTEADLVAALKAGGNVMLGANIAMTNSVAIDNANFVIDGNGYTITMAENATNAIALFDITGGTVAFKNVIFDGIRGGAIVRTVDAKFYADNMIAQNSNHTQQQGLFRLLGESAFENCVFKNNTCSIVISFNFDANSSDKPQSVKNCLFEENTCSSIGVVYYAYGDSCTISGNSFVRNTIDTNANGATLYLGYKSNCEVTNNLFLENSFISTGTSARCSGGVMFGSNITVKGNAFIDNTAENANGKLGGDVCASSYYYDLDVSGNYWGGSAPVMDEELNDDYRYNDIIVNSIATSYTVDADGAGVTVA